MALGKAALIERALTILSVVNASNPVGAEDARLVGGVIEPLLRQLAADQVCYVASTDDIADELFLPLARRLALEVAGDFGVQAPFDKASLENDLRRLSRLNATYQPLRTTYF
jgi:hypothetical protein